MKLLVYNTLTKTKEEFQPLEPNKVKMYVCGVTVYDYCHIGHARSAVVFDVIYRYFLFLGYDVVYVRNFTDIDDKIIRRAQEEHTDYRTIAERYIEAFYEDMDRLGVLRPTVEPRATEHIKEMIEIIQKLFDKGYAYQSGRDVYFSVERFPGYGKLSGRSLEDMMAGARVDIDEHKRNPFDFVLWKGSKEGEPAWDSPWGPGRPGWHIECSAMSAKYLGETFDIHGGGKDLIFPHHENEIAQSEAAFGKPFVRYWLHNGFVNINNEKMSKSLGNFLTIREILDKVHPEALRLFVISKHYRNPVDFSDEAIREAERGLERLYMTLSEALERIGGACPPGGKVPRPNCARLNWLLVRFHHPAFGFGTGWQAPGQAQGLPLPGTEACPYTRSPACHPERSEGSPTCHPGTPLLLDKERIVAFSNSKRAGTEACPYGVDPELSEKVLSFPEKFLEAMNNDFNTAQAVGLMFDLRNALQRFLESSRRGGGARRPALTGPASELVELAIAFLREAGSILGILERAPEAFFREQNLLKLKAIGMTEEEVESWIAKRAEARKEKRFDEADRIRAMLAEKSIQLEDTPNGTRWRVGG
jgi:cysteinyl-tRNA synthetase